MPTYTHSITHGQSDAWIATAGDCIENACNQCSACAEPRARVSVYYYNWSSACAEPRARVSVSKSVAARPRAAKPVCCTALEHCW